MSEVDPTALGAADLAAAIARGALSPVAVVDAYLDRIARLDGRLHAYISVYPELARDAARAAEAKVRAGAPLGPLHGVPVAVKDLFQVAGMARTCGSRSFSEPAQESDSTAVARLKAAGAIVLGLVNLHEFAFGPTGINQAFGTARNPWDQSRACGGSSAGSGCAVSAGLAAATLGTDTGGSIRIPASLCGIVGLKQTYGLASRAGIFPLCEGFDHGGPMTRTVRDAALLLQAIAGPDPADPTSWGAQVKDYMAGLDEGAAAGLRIGVPEAFFWQDLHPEVEAAARAALAQLAELGATVRPVTLPVDAEAVGAAWDTIALAEAFALHETRLENQGDALSPDVARRMRRGSTIGAGDLVRAHWLQNRARRDMAALFADVDLLATPTTRIPAVDAESGAIAVAGESVDGARVLAALTRFAAFTGQPAISVPCGFTGDGLPIGLQLIGRWYEEPVLLGAAHAYEQAAGWWRRRPDLAA